MWRIITKLARERTVLTPSLPCPAGFVGDLVHGVADVVETVITGVIGVIGAVVDGIANFFTGAVEAVGDFFSNIFGRRRSLIAAALETFDTTNHTNPEEMLKHVLRQCSIKFLEVRGAPAKACLRLIAASYIHAAALSDPSATTSGPTSTQSAGPSDVSAPARMARAIEDDDAASAAVDPATMAAAGATGSSSSTDTADGASKPKEMLLTRADGTTVAVTMEHARRGLQRLVVYMAYTCSQRDAQKVQEQAQRRRLLMERRRSGVGAEVDL